MGTTLPCHHLEHFKCIHTSVFNHSKTHSMTTVYVCIQTEIMRNISEQLLNITSKIRSISLVQPHKPNFTYIMDYVSFPAYYSLCAAVNVFF